MNISGIYKIQSKLKPERIYIGSAVNISKRWYYHLVLLRRNKQPNLILQNHYNKYGESDLQFSVLLGCNAEDLLRNEQYFIDSYNPYFNICKTAGSQLGLKRSEKTCKQMSKSKKGCAAWNKGMRGIYSEKALKKMGEASKGRILSGEHKLKISISMKGKQNCLGNKLSEDHKRNIGKGLKGKKYKKRKE